jgi:hypothetical protein
VCFAYLLLLIYLDPYADPIFSHLQEAASLQLVFSLLIGMLLVARNSPAELGSAGTGVSTGGADALLMVFLALSACLGLAIFYYAAHTAKSAISLGIMHGPWQGVHSRLQLAQGKIHRIAVAVEGKIHLHHGPKEAVADHGELDEGPIPLGSLLSVLSSGEEAAGAPQDPTSPAVPSPE